MADEAASNSRVTELALSFASEMNLRCPPINGATGQVLAKTSDENFAYAWITSPYVGTVTSVGASGGTTGLTFSGSPITTSGTLTLSGTLAVASGGTGITAFGTGVATALGQNVTGSGGIVLASSPTLTTPNLGTPSAVTLTNGTGLSITSGTTGTLTVARGGTGQTAYTDGQLLIGNTATGGLEKATLSAGSNVTITNGNGTITIDATGGGGSGTVTSVSGTGTVNGISLSGTVTTSGNITLGGALSGVNLMTQVTGTLPVANGGTGITSFGTGVAGALGANVTGSGGIVLATSPSLTTPALGTPSAAVLTNATGLPLTTGVTGTLGAANGGTGITSPGSSGNVLTSDGTSWTSAAPTGSAITTLWVRQEQASGTAPAEGSPTSATWTTRVLNTTSKNTISGASLASNQVTLPAGTFEFEVITSAGSNAASSPRQVVRLQNITDTALIANSGAVRPQPDASNNPGTALITLQGCFTLASSKVLEVQQYAVGTTGAGSFGIALNSGSITEVYVDALFRKVA